MLVINLFLFFNNPCRKELTTNGRTLQCPMHPIKLFTASRSGDAANCVCNLLPRVLLAISRCLLVSLELLEKKLFQNILAVYIDLKVIIKSIIIINLP